MYIKNTTPPTSDDKMDVEFEIRRLPATKSISTLIVKRLDNVSFMKKKSSNSFKENAAKRIIPQTLVPILLHVYSPICPQLRVVHIPEELSVGDVGIGVNSQWAAKARNYLRSKV